MWRVTTVCLGQRLAESRGQPFLVENRAGAALKVYGTEIFPWIDLRVDHHPERIAELRRIHDIHRPLLPYY